MNSRKISRFFVYFFLTVGALIMLLPFFWMFSSAFKTTDDIFINAGTTMDNHRV